MEAAEYRLLRFRLGGEKTIEFLVAVGRNQEVIITLQLQGDMRTVLISEYCWKELGIHAPGVVQKLLDKAALIYGAETGSRRFFACKPPAIGFGANDQHELSVEHLLVHELNPALRREGF